MVGFLEIPGPNCHEILHRPLPKATHVCFKTKEEETRRRRRTCTREVEDPLMGLSHFHYGNDTEPADEPVDPASDQSRRTQGRIVNFQITGRCELKLHHDDF